MRVRAVVVGAVAAVAIVVAALLGVSPAESQEVAGVRFTWEINFTTLIVVIGAAFGWWFTVVRQGDKVAAHAKTIANLETELASKVEAEALGKVQQDIEALGLRVVTLQHEHQTLKDEVYREYLNADAVREIKKEIRDDVAGTEKRLMTAIGELSKRIDRFQQKQSAAED